MSSEGGSGSSGPADLLQKSASVGASLPMPRPRVPRSGRSSGSSGGMDGDLLERSTSLESYMAKTDVDAIAEAFVEDEDEELLSREPHDEAAGTKNFDESGSSSSSDGSEYESSGAEGSSSGVSGRPAGLDGGDMESIGQGILFLGQEDDEGNVEYKWKLVDPEPERFEHLVTQMKFRLTEGQGEAFYEIGVEDSGFPKGVSQEELEKSLDTLRRMAAELSADITVLCEKDGEEGKVAEVLVRKLHDGGYIDLRVAVCGNVDSGKSTTIGVLTRGVLDNGRGLARSHVFVHKHEIETGRTSSVSHQILGFNSKSEIVNYSHFNPSWSDIVQEASKVVTFIDLAGHEKYLKTTVFGMTANLPDYAMLVVGANMGVTRMTKEHIGLCLALKLPFFVLITKVDICPPNVLEETLNTLTKILRYPGVRKVPYMVKCEDDVVTSAKNMPTDHVVPFFQVSNVSGESLDYVRKFLNLVPLRQEWEERKSEPCRVVLDETFYVTGVGTVVSGTVTAGNVKVGDTLLLGPDGNGKFKPIQIRGVHAKRVPVRSVHAGVSASFALKKIKRNQIRKGMVLLHKTLQPRATWEFEAEIVILFHSTTINVNYQPVIHVGTVRQCAKILSMSQEILRTGDRGVVRFRFMFRPEYIQPGTRIIFREGRTKGIGMIKSVAEDG